MITVSVTEAESHFSEYLKRVEAGETVVLTRRNQPIAELRAVSKTKRRARRPIGLCEGEFKVPDDFDEPLPPDIQRAFEGA
ncbi:MAG TPA: type II toxin-antitoxin system prevent-host-death family antitoxin [Candidatus Xenobia bacterium]|jgi:prevent-host-death family protein